MIDKQTQDQLWKCAPKTFREAVKNKWEDTDSGSYAENLIESIFGLGNLTSDAEPEEMLCCSRKKVQELYSEALKAVPTCEHDRGYRNAEFGILKRLFGSKCLPDEEKSEIQIMHDDSKAEPRFKVGDMVRCLNDREVYIVMAKVGKYHYALQGVEHDVHEDLIEPYAEPTQTNNNMEEKELKVNEGVAFLDADNDMRPGKIIHIAPNGVVVATPNGEVHLVPSENINPKNKRWRAEDGDEYWYFDLTYTPQKTTDEYIFEDTLRYKSGNYFKTEDLCNQAAKAVRKTLEQFHKDRQQ